MSRQDDLKKLITEYTRRLQKLKEQQARKGIDTEPHILVEIEEIEAIIEELQAELAELERTDEPPAQPLVQEQRKLVTVLRMEVVGLDNLVASLDPEEAAEMINALWQRIDAEITVSGGQIERHTDSQMRALWGAGTAREDDPEQAIRAALAIRDAVHAFCTEQQITLSIRVGITTGVVRIGGVGTTGESSATGPATTLTSQLVQAAPNGGILIAHDTYRHVRGLFAVQTRDPLVVPNRTEALQVYLVQYAKPRRFRIHTRGVEGVETHMIGRDAELKHLQDAFVAAVEDAECAVITVVSEPGLGKSRLLYEFDAWVELHPETVWYAKGRATAAAQQQPYALLRDMFALRFDIQDSDPAAMVRDKLERGFGAVFGETDDGRLRARIIGHLLGFAIGGDALPRGVADDPRQIRDRGLIDLTAYFTTLTNQAAVLIVLEDLHWADEASLDTLAALAEALERARLLIVGTARPSLFERRSHWGEPPYYSRIDLRPLSRRYSLRLVEEILQRVDDLPTDLRDLIVDRAEGNPFYVEELIKMLIDDGAIRIATERWVIDRSRLQSARVPTTLTEVLLARLDSLSPPEQVTLQRAAVVGRIFWDAAVAELGDRQIERAAPEPAALPEALETLRRRELLFRHERSSFSAMQEYVFKHALLRDVTYERVLKRARRIYHGQTARWLAAVSERSGRADEYATRIAEHYEQAGDQPAAAAWYGRAGVYAAAQHANPAAVDALSRALALTPEADITRRYDLLLAREKVYDLQGDRGAQVGDLEALERLADALNDDARRAEAALRRSNYAEALGDYPAAIAAAQQALTLAHTIDNVSAEAEGYLRWGRSLWRQADYAGAQTQLKQALDLARIAGRDDVQTRSLQNLANIAYRQHDYAEARAYCEQSLAIARAGLDRQQEGRMLGILGNVAYGQGDDAEARAYYEQSLAIAREVGDRQLETWRLGTLGKVAYRQGDDEGARAHYEQALAIARVLGDRQQQGWVFGSFGDIAYRQGDDEGARAHYEQALAIARAVGDRLQEGRRLGTLGNVAYRQHDYGEARAYYEQALAITRALDDRQLESRVLAPLGNVAHSQGDDEGARAHYEQALAIARVLGDRQLEGLILGILENVIDSQGDDIEARVALAQRHMAEALIDATPF